MTALSLATLAALVAGVPASASPAARPGWRELLDRHTAGNPFTFHEYVSTFGKDYATGEEYEQRRELFEKRLEGVIAHNKLGHSWQKGINHMSDWTDAEYESQMGYNPKANGQLEAVQTEAPPAQRALPASVDWRACSGYGRSDLCPNNNVATSVVTPIKNQLRCGSCYAFGSTAVLESHLAIQTGTYMDLAPQHIVSCAANPQHCGGTGGCQGSTADVVYSWIHKTGGLASEFDYGYTSGLGSTGTCQTLRTTTKWAKVGPVLGKPLSNNYTSLMEALMIGPVAVNVYASHWRDYESGIYDGCKYTDDITLNHVVALEGYGPGYWLIRNSWGPNYGEGGYIKLHRESQELCGTDSRPADGWDCDTPDMPKSVRVCGQCGVAYEPTYPTGVTN